MPFRPPSLRLLGSVGTMCQTVAGAKTDCSYCRAPCCQLVVELRLEEVARFEHEDITLDGETRKILKRREDGYCVYHVLGQGCSTYEDRPSVCLYYSCREDRRITPSLKYGTPRKLLSV